MIRLLLYLAENGLESVCIEKLDALQNKRIIISQADHGVLSRRIRQLAEKTEVDRRRIEELVISNLPEQSGTNP